MLSDSKLRKLNVSLLLIFEIREKQKILPLIIRLFQSRFFLYRSKERLESEKSVFQEKPVSLFFYCVIIYKHKSGVSAFHFYILNQYEWKGRDTFLLFTALLVVCSPFFVISENHLMIHGVIAREIISLLDKGELQ